MMTSLLLAVILFSMLHSIGVRVRLWIKVIVYGSVAALLFPIWKMFNGSSYAAGIIEVTDTGDGYVSRMTGAFNVFEHYPYLLAVIMLLTCIAVLFLSRKRKISRRSVLGYMVFILLWIFIYTVEAALKTDFSLLPFLYMFAQVMLAITYDQVRAHDISSMITDSQKDHAVRSYIAIGLNGRFLGANRKSYDFFPELENQKADTRFSEDSEIGKRFGRIIGNYTENGVETGFFRPETGRWPTGFPISP